MSSIYYNIFKGICGRSGRGITGQPSGYPSGLVSFYNPNAASATRAFVGPQPVYASASQQPDANSNLVTWPNYVPGRGVEVHPAYTNKTSGGTPVSNATFSAGELLPTATTAVHFVGMGNEAFTVGEKYFAQFRAKNNGARYLKLVQWSQYCNFDLIDGVVTLSSGMTGSISPYTDGYYDCVVEYTHIDNAVAIPYLALSPNNTAHWDDIYLGVVTDGVFIDSTKWSITAGCLFQIIPPGTSVASTAATSAGNGLAIPMDSRMTAALGGIFTAGAIVNMRASSAEVTADTNILAVNNNITGGIYMAASGILKAFDGTNTATVTVTGGWARDDEILIVWWINAAGTNQQIGYKKKADSTITWGTAASYDGSVNPGTHLRYGYTIDKPLGIIHSHLWNKSVATDAEILDLIDRYVN